MDTAIVQVTVSAMKVGMTHFAINVYLLMDAVSVCACDFKYYNISCLSCEYYVFIKAVVGGYCNSPGECVCQDGYTGVNCRSKLNFFTSYPFVYVCVCCVCVCVIVCVCVCVIV